MHWPAGGADSVVRYPRAERYEVLHERKREEH